MSYVIVDEDEWETVFTQAEPTGLIPGTNWPYGGSCNFTRRRRSPEEVKQIKAERLRKEEDEILARAERIIAARASAGA